MPVAIYHDGVARFELMRRCVPTEEGCAWCGNTRPSEKLFEYGVEHDGIQTKTHWDGRYFCQKPCRTCFYE